MNKEGVKKETRLEPLVHLLIVVLIAILIVNFFLINSLSSTVQKKIQKNEEAAKPAQLEITIIQTDKPCKECFDTNQALALIKKGNVEITKEQTLKLSEAKDLIEEYNIKKLPTIIVKGQTNKTDLSYLTLAKDAHILTNIPLPYYDIEESRTVGLIDIKIINPLDCKECFDMNKLVQDLRINGVAITKVVNFTEDEAKELIEKYSLKILPAIIISPDLKYYPSINENWQTYGTIMQDKTYLSAGKFPPYKNLETKETEGLANVTYITDNSCKECYDVKLHKQIIEGFEVSIASEETIDISEAKGKELINKYNITLVPTIIISKEGDLYNNFLKAFAKVSKRNEDGSRIFNQPQIIGMYKDLTTNKVIKPEQGKNG